MLSIFWRHLLAFYAGAKGLRRRPDHAITSVLLLGVSSGALFLITAIVDALLVRPPSGRAIDELVFIRPIDGGGVGRRVYIELARRNSTLSSASAWPHSPGEVAASPYLRFMQVRLQANGQHRPAFCHAVSANFFSTLGVSATEGRVFRADDDRAGAEPVALLRMDLLQALELQVGEWVEINARPFRIVGSLPTDYQTVDRSVFPEVWIPLAHAGVYIPGDQLDAGGWLSMLGRLAPGISAEAARVDLDAVAREIHLESAGSTRPLKFSVLSFTAARFASDGQRPRRVLLLGSAAAASFLLAICNFMLSTLLRALARRREVALRLALGAPWGMLASWLMGELLLVLTLGLGLGYALSTLGLAWLQRQQEFAAWLRAAAVALDLRCVGFVLISTLPALALVWGVTRVGSGSSDLSTRLAESPSAPRWRRALSMLLATQLGLACVLLALSLASVGALWAAKARALSVSTQGVLVMNVDVRELGPFDDRGRSNALYTRMIRQLQGVPGVLHAAGSNYEPLHGSNFTHVMTRGCEPAQAPDRCRARFAFVSPDYFSALASEFEQGRPMLHAELEQAANAVVINRAMADRFWPHESPLGETFPHWVPGQLNTVVGVVDKAPAPLLKAGNEPQFYLPFTTNTNPLFTLVVRVEGDPASMRQRLTAALRSTWPFAEPPEWHELSQAVDSQLSSLLAIVQGLLWTALVSSGVAASGLYYTSAFTATTTIRDSMLRLALGATWQGLVRAQLRRHVGSVLAGLSLGGIMAWGTGPLLAGLDVELTAPGHLHVALAAALLLPVVGLGLSLPVWRLRNVRVGQMLARE